MKIRSISIIQLCLLAVSPSLLAETNSHTHKLRFNVEDLRIEEAEAEGNLYSVIKLKELNNNGEPGDPSLPWSAFSVSVPPEAVDFRVSVIGSKPQFITLAHQPMPVQYAVSTSTEYGKTPFVTLATKYTRDSAVYPEKNSVVRCVSTIGGFNRVVTVAVTPFAWSMADNVLAMQEEIQVTITWRTDSSATETLLYPGFGEVSDEAMDMTRDVVVNPNAVGSHPTTLSRLKRCERALSANERIPYMIVTTKELAGAFERLAALRRLRGVHAKVVCIEDVLSDSRFKDGDVISGIKDNAGKLRAFLRDAYTNQGTNFVLLAGKFPAIPGRWVKQIFPQYADTSYYVTNHYFANLNAVWKTEERDGICHDEALADYGTTISVGRLNCSTISQVNNYIDKLVKYEFPSKGTSLDYLNNGFAITGENNMPKSNPEYDRMVNMYNKILHPDYSENYDRLKTVFADSCAPYYGSDLIADLNENDYGYIDFHCHGSRVGIITHEPQTGISYGVLAMEETPSFFQSECSNGLNNWQNKNSPNWSIGVSCDTGELVANSSYLTFAESYLFGGSYGGVAYLCNSGSGLMRYSEGLSNLIFKEAVKDFNYGSSVSYAGIPYVSYAERLGKHAYPYEYYNNKVIPTLYLAGDPMTMLWARKPYDAWNDNGYLRISGYKENFWMHTGELDLANNTVKGSNTPMYVFFELSPLVNRIRTYYSADIRPVIVPTQFSDFCVTANKYIFCGEAFLKNINKANSDISLQLLEGVNCTVESLENVHIESTISTDKSALFKLVAREQIDVRNTRVLEYSNIEFKTAGEVVLLKDVVFERGAVVSMQ